MALENWAPVVDIVNKGVATVAIVWGGIWVFYNFVQGRAYRRRLEPKVVGTVICKNGLNYLSVLYELKSVGLPRTTIIHKKSGLLIYSCQSLNNVNGLEEVEWRQESAHSVFDKHQWIERDETITGTLLIATPSSDYLAFRLELTIFVGKVEWNTEAIVGNVAPQSGTMSLNPGKE